MLLFGLASLGCGSTPVVQTRPLPSPVVAHSSERLDPALFEQAIGDREGAAYRIGPGDTLLVAVYGHPELSIATYAGANLGKAAGFVVDNDGTVQMPLIGSMRASGQTCEELRQVVERQLAGFLREPRVTIQISSHGSIRYYLLGQFSQPGLKVADRPMRLLEALSLGGSVLFEHSSLISAYIARDGKRLPIDFQRLLREGDLGQNIPMHNGDIVVVPDSGGDQAFVFGGVVGERSGGVGVVPFVNGQLNILQALAQAGFGFRERSQAVLSKSRVIRSRGDRGELFIVDVERILDGQAAPFHLMPGDIIFVPTSTWTDWNNALAQLLPTLQTVSGLLSPFVQLKYLQQK